MKPEKPTMQEERRKSTPYERECASRLKRIAKSKGITQPELAEQLGVEQSTISHYYTGRNPLNVEKLIEFSRALHCMPNDIDPDRVIFKLFSKEELRLFGAIRSLPEARRREALAYLAGYLSSEST